MQNSESIDAIMARLENGEVLMIDDQLRSYIGLETGDGPDRFVMRSILAHLEDEMKRVDMTPRYKERRFRSLVEALLSLMDCAWCNKDGEIIGRRDATLPL